jgi:cytochrome c-type biogenesis protein CcsB
MTLGIVLLSAALVALLASVVLAALAGAFAALSPIVAVPNCGPALPRQAAPLRVARPIATWLAAALLVAALAMRAVEVGHAPWSNLHEFTSAFAAALLLAYLALARRMPIEPLAAWVSLVAAALVAYALALPSTAQQLVPALQAPLLLTVHVGAAMLAYAVSGLAFVAAVGELAQRRAGDRIAALPSEATCRGAAHRSVLIAFPILTLAILLGSVWANMAWRSYWNNDPKELSAAATWLVYAAYLHVAGRRDRLGRLAPWLLVVGFGAVLFTFLGAGLLFVGQHSYALP